MSAHTVGVVAAVVVAVVLLVAGISKLSSPHRWRDEASDLGVHVAVATPVPYVEVVLGALLLVQLQRSIVAWVALALFVGFTALLVVRLAQGRRPRCACFGSLSAAPIGVSHVVRNLLFIALALVAALA